MRLFGAVVSIFGAGIFCLMLNHAVLAATPEEANKQLIEAVLKNDLDAVQRSIGEGADPSVSNDKGLSAIDIAVDKGFFDIAHYLLAAGNQKNQNLASPPVPSPIAPGTPNPAPSIAVQATPLGNQTATPAQAGKEPKRALSVAAPPIDRQLVAEEPEPIVILPVVPETQNEPKSNKQSAPGDKLLIEADNSSEQPGFVEQLTNLFSPSTPQPTVDDAPETEPQTKKPKAAASDPGPTREPARDPVQIQPGSDTLKPETETEPEVTIVDKIGELFSSKEKKPEPPVVTALDELEVLDPALVDEPSVASTPSKRKGDAAMAGNTGSVPQTSAGATTLRPSDPAPQDKAAYTEVEEPLKSDGVKPGVEMQALPSSGDEIQPTTPLQAKDAILKDAAQISDSVRAEEKSPDALKAAEPSQESVSFIESIGNFFSTDKPPQPEQELSSLDELESFDQTQDKPATDLSVSEPPKLAGSVAPQAVKPETAARLGPKQDPKQDLPVRPNNSVNPFTRLTDLILDILPESKNDSEGANAQTEAVSKQPEMPGSNNPQAQKVREPTPEPEKVKFPVEDLTTRDDPYMVAASPSVRNEQKAQRQEPALTETAVLVPIVPQSNVEVPQTEKENQRSLTENDLSYGEDGRIESLMPEDISIKRNCVEKKAWDSYFCIQDFEWPPRIQDAFGAPIFFQGGGRSIVHYVGGRSAQYHGLFPTASFSQIASFLVTEYGAPSERPEQWTAMLAEAKRRNQIFRWIAPATDGGRDLVLEIREIDDLRWSAPPDKSNGVIRLFRKGDKSIFRLLTTADLLLLQVRKGNDPPSPPDVPLK